jgi:hypothetical protein
MKKTLTPFLFFLSASFFPAVIMAQFVCETVTSEKYAQEEEEFNAWVLDFRDQGGHLDTSVLFIPTVIHIVMKSPEDTITMERVLWQIEQTNIHMRRQNADTVDTREMFRAVAADTHIELCLATIKPDGGTFEGVVWHFVPGKSADELEMYMADQNFDTDKYLNVWVRPDTSAASGTFPWMSHQGNDGIRMSHRLFGTDPVGGDPLHQQGKVLTHELGHYLGLYHTFHFGNWFVGNCDPPHCDFITDRCCDTPLDWSFPAWVGESCEFSGLICPENDSIIYPQNENYMYYNPDWCVNMFSNDQRIRMRATLSSIRASLCSDENLAATGAHCSPATIISPPEKTLQFRIYPNPASDAIYIEYGDMQPVQAQVTIYNMMGKALIRDSGTDLHRISLQGLPPGLYLIRIRLGDLVVTEKMIITPD